MVTFSAMSDSSIVWIPARLMLSVVSLLMAMEPEYVEQLARAVASAAL